MLGGFVGGLFTAWILTWFGIDNMLLEVLQPHVELTLELSHYYVAFGLIGLVGGAFNNGNSN